MSGAEPAERRPRRLPDWPGAVVAAAGLVVVLWVCVTSWGAVSHAHPAYPVLLALTAILSIAALALALARRRTGRRGRLPLVLQVLGLVAGALVIAAVAWLRPHTAVEPALAALRSDGAVVVQETFDAIVIAPRDGAKPSGLFFQPGALVDARAYAAVLRPVAQDGRTVVIAKQPLGIAFLAVGAFDSARADHPSVTAWVVGGHSLGGTVAAIGAGDGQADTSAPAAGLLLYASYPATDMSVDLAVPVLSISGTRDGLATPEKIESSRQDLPPGAVFEVIVGASHAQFGSYGRQAGDNTPTISNEHARVQISDLTREFVAATLKG